MLNAGIEDEATNVVWWQAAQVDAEGRIASELLGNGLYTTRDYDPATGQLLGIRTGGINTSDIQDIAYSYDATNNVRTRYDRNIDLSAEFAYDTLDRLTRADVRHTDATLPINQSLLWEYDQAGNIEARTQNGSRKTFSYATDPGGRKRLLTVDGLGTLDHDGNGNVVATGGRSVSWNASNKPVLLSNATTSIAYTYGPERQAMTRVETKGTATTRVTYVDSGYELVTLDDSAAGTSIQEYRWPIFAGDKVVATRTRVVTNGVGSRRAEYYHRDALGSVDVVTDSIGRIKKRYSYDPFGKRSDATYLDVQSTHPTISNPSMLMTRGFGGHEHMDDLDFIHMGGRVYDTATGRFLSPDPFTQNPLSTPVQSFFANTSLLSDRNRKSNEAWVRTATGARARATAARRVARSARRPAGCGCDR